MKLQYGKYEFTCRFEKEAVLPDFKGSTFHGVFDRALKNVVCVLKQQTCEKCPLLKKCLYARVFETKLACKPEKGSRFSDIPHPYFIEPPMDRENSFQKHGIITCWLGLFGEFTESLPYFIYAFDLMGKTGLGRRIGGSRGRFTLTKVASNHKTIYTDTDKTINMEGCRQELTINPSDGDKYQKIEVKLETPLRVKHGQRIVGELPFHVLTRAMLRRISSLMSVYGDGEPNWNYKELVEKAEQVQTLSAKLHWLDRERYSFRQKQRTPMGGLIGTVIYENVPPEFLPMLEFCEQVHIGKNTTFGLGKISVDVLKN